MANFNAHISSAACVSMVVGTVLFGAHLATGPQSLAYIALGTLGGILPDIDADQSIALKIVFQLLSGLIAFLIMFKLMNITAIVLGLLLWGVIFAGIRFGLCHYFCEFTTHRGIFHSVPVGVIFCFFVAIISFYLLDLTALVSWLAGMFLLAGYIIHLLIDEVGSIGKKKVVKKFFKSLEHLVGLSNGWTFLIAYAIAITLFFFTPPMDKLWGHLFTYKSLIAIVTHLLPGF